MNNRRVLGARNIRTTKKTEWLAELYVKYKNKKLKSLSRVVEDAPYDLTRDQVMSVFKQIKTLENDLFCMKYIVYFKGEIRVCQCSEAKQIAELVVAKFAELN